MKKNGDFLFLEMGAIDEQILNEVEKLRHMKHNKLKKYSVSIAGALAIIVAIPNISSTVAYASYEIPILGEIFHVATFRSYEKSGDTDVIINLPQVSTGDEIIDETLSKITVDYTELLVNKFKDETQDDLGLIDISYDVITDTKGWFTLCIYSTEIKGSGYDKAFYYHVDKTSGEIVQLEDLFNENVDYISIINSNISNQIAQEIETDENLIYFFESIQQNQNFYFNEEGTLVIVFDEYEVAPGYMGIVKFEIGQDVLSY